MRRKLLLWFPLLAIAGLALFFIAGMKRDRADNGDFVESAMVGQPVPEFSLMPVMPNQPGLSSADLKDGQPRLINFFASWCLPCIAEAPQLLVLQQAGVQIEGIAVRDQPKDVARFLEENGNPFHAVVIDKGGQAQVAFGSSAQPETFLISGDGTILYQHIGDIRADQLPMLLEKWKSAQ